MLSIADLPSCREGGLADQLQGSAVRLVATPQSLAELCALMRLAHERDLVPLPRGSGSKLTWLHLPPVVDVLIDLSALSHIRLDPATSAVTAGAAAPVARVQDELARHGRRLALDPPSPRATIGGMTVAAELGPLAYGFGPPAAYVSDAVVVLPDGTVTSVADRARLLGASVCDLRWAYPGWPSPACVVAEVTLATRPLPESQVWLTFPIAQPLRLAQLRDDILAAEVSPAAIEVDLPGVRRGATATGHRHAAGALSVLLEGSEAGVLDRCDRLARRLTDDSPHRSARPPAWWRRYPFRPGEIAVRLQMPDGQLHSVCYALADAVGSPVPVRGSVGSGLAWACLPSDLSVAHLVLALEALRDILLARGGTAVVQAAPLELRDIVAPYRHP